MRTRWRIFGVVILIVVSFVSGLFLQNPFKKIILRQDVLATDNDCPYEYVNQLRCEPDINRQKKEYVSLRNDLVSYIEGEKNAGNAKLISVYFRDLQNGPTLSIDASEDFAPASLLKVPLMIMYLKKAEGDPSLLSKKIRVAGDLESLDQNIEPTRRVTPGNEYAIEELLNLLVTQSDNTAWKVLLNYLRENNSEEEFIITLSDLGIIDPRKDNDSQYITVQNYASIFRILYNSSYLNPEMSNKALKLLTDSAFNDGLEAGTPNVEVAHKFGERLNADTGEQQLHDCGIVYYPPNPYLVCVMTKGDDIDELERVIKEISLKVYKEVAARN